MLLGNRYQQKQRTPVPRERRSRTPFTRWRRQSIGHIFCWRSDGAERTVRSTRSYPKKKEPDMLWTIFVVLLVLWLLGLVSSYTLGGFIHILLVLALVVLVINLLSGRRSAV
jgi:hypothetical protein